MLICGLHKEDVKAGLRKRFGSVAAFERQNRLPEKSVTEIFRGRKSARVMLAIEAALNEPLPDASLEPSSRHMRHAAAECLA